MPNLQASVLECPHCGAPVDPARRVAELVACDYCGVKVSLSAREPAAAPAGAAPLPPTVADHLLDLRSRGLPALFGLLAGFSVVCAGFVFARSPGGNEIPCCVAAAAALLYALVCKRRLYAMALGLGVGLLVALKPVLRPIVQREYNHTFSATSETALWFVLPGAGLVVLAFIALLQIRPARLRADLALLRPSLFATLGFCSGLLVSAILFGLPTNTDVFAKWDAALLAKAHQYQAMAAWVNSDARAALPRQVAGLSPLPVYLEDDLTSNADVAGVHHFVVERGDRRGDLLLNGRFLGLHTRREHRWWRDEWGLDSDLEGRLRALFAERYLAMYRCNSRQEGDAHAGCRAVLFDVTTGVALVEVGPAEAYTSALDTSDALLEELTKATGGRFERSRH